MTEDEGSPKGARAAGRRAEAAGDTGHPQRDDGSAEAGGGGTGLDEGTHRLLRGAGGDVGDLERRGTT